VAQSLERIMTISSAFASKLRPCIVLEPSFGEFTMA